MGGMRITELDFVRLLPVFMQDDEAILAFCNAMNKLLGEPGKRLSTIRTWDKIDELTEAECDELAWELDVDWYDSTGMTLEEKREALKLVQQIKRKRGTKWAVERLISSLLGEGRVAEWDEIDAPEYTFVVLTTSTDVTAENFAKFVETANIAKNERSHMTGIYYYWEQGPENGIAYDPGETVHRYDFRDCGTYPRPAVVGMLMKSPGVETEAEETRHLYDFKKCGNIKSRVAVVGTAIVGADRTVSAPDGQA